MKKPNPLRAALPLAIGYLPATGAFFWLRVMDIVHEMAKLKPATFSSEVAFIIIASAVIGSLAAVYRLWADFVRGDYYADLIEWQDRRWRGRGTRY